MKAAPGNRNSMIGRVVGVRPKTGHGRTWWVRVKDTSLDGGYVLVTGGFAFGRDRWVKASDCQAKSKTATRLLAHMSNASGQPRLAQEKP